ncbi:HesA/MoeB/ThiF family protein [Candidatus Vallotiella sp. (ex Adelges kitamiensis)]|uniref:HesA/MoeB/ThiF family protein n=1 Tax=Candidatus Vallotiella sp. (ex Adelges kitamiensis) TaxID=2864217 RepID=UPI001CE28843|nr:HesA/MoeB/ThiF family protein [Candidatus Vallotia sp. (ex Adelges kitamiensis)]
MNDDQLLRYSRHILLDEIGIEAQHRFLNAHVLIVGVGGLGSPAAMYLAAAGIGTLTLVDADTVELTNLQRQILHPSDSIGQTKVESGRATLAHLNPEVCVNAINSHADDTLLQKWVSRAHIVLDCTDNYITRHIINRACVQHRVPLVSGAALRFDGQISTFDARDPASPCYACIFPTDRLFFNEVACSTMGIFSPLVGIIGAMQAAEALRVIAEVGCTLVGRLMMLDAMIMHWQTIRIGRQADCLVCGSMRLVSHF